MRPDGAAEVDGPGARSWVQAKGMVVVVAEEEAESNIDLIDGD